MGRPRLVIMNLLTRSLLCMILIAFTTINFGFNTEVRRSLYWIFLYNYPLFWTILIRHFSSMIFFSSMPRFRDMLPFHTPYNHGEGELGFWVGENTLTSLALAFLKFFTLWFQPTSYSHPKYICAVDLSKARPHFVS